MKINTLKKITDFLIYEENINPTKFSIAKERYKNQAATIVCYFITKELNLHRVNLGRSIQKLDSDHDDFQKGLKYLKNNILSNVAEVNSEIISEPAQPKTEGKKVTRVIGIDKKTKPKSSNPPPVPARKIGDLTLEEMDNLYQLNADKPIGGNIEIR